MHQLSQQDNLIERYCAKDDLSTYDPYDIWKTRLGFQIKKAYNSHRRLLLPLAAGLTLLDTFFNNRKRCFYTPQEYPIVRAMAAQSLLNLYRSCGDARYLSSTVQHLDWLIKNACTGYQGLGWGLHFPHAVDKGIIYDGNTPFSTITPYVLEAFIQYTDLTGDQCYIPVISRIHRFFVEDIKVMEESKESMAMSYAPLKDRIVINASSYAMWSFAVLLNFLGKEDKAEAERRIRKLYRFIREQQREDGSWMYSPTPGSFIDCFHSCIVLKNLYKTSQRAQLDGCRNVISRGYQYLKTSLLDPKTGLYRRFSMANKPGLVRFDLYDNAEMLNLSLLLGDVKEAKRLLPIIDKNFREGDEFYSQIVLGGLKRNRNMLRWAIMPYLYGISQFN